MQVYDVIIIGSGPAGLTAGIYASRANLKTLIAAGDTWGGQLMLTTEVENYPGFEEGIMGSELMEKMRKQAVRFGCEWVGKNVTRVDFSVRPFRVWIGEEIYSGKTVIVAVGAETKWLGVPGEAKLIGRGVSSCAPCDAPFFKNKRVVVVGGGDAAMEEAMVLTKFASEVTLIHRRGEFRASKIMIERVMKNEKIKVWWDTEVEEFTGEQKLEGLKLKTASKRWGTDSVGMLERGRGEMVKEGTESVQWKVLIDGIFVTVGHSPMTKIFDKQVELDEKGYLLKIQNSKFKTQNFRWLKEAWQKDFEELRNKYPMMTSQEGVFTAGDVHDCHYRQAITAAGYGCMGAMDAEKWLEDQD